MESTASLTFDELANDVAWYLGYGREDDIDNPTNWTSDQKDTVFRITRLGIRLVYTPPVVVVGGRPISHQWRFLRPWTTLVAWKTATGTMSVGGTGNKTITDNTNKPFYRSMVGATLTANTSWNKYTIESYISSSQITVDSDASADDGDTFRITATGDYQLDDQCAGIYGDIYFGDTTGYPPISIGSEGQIRLLRQSSISSGRPTRAAVRAEANTTGQRFWLMLHPTPSSDYVLRFRQVPAYHELGSGDYPLGGAMHAELFRAACLAAAERELNDTKGEKWDYFMERLPAHIELDRRQFSPESLGVMTDPGARARKTSPSLRAGLGVTYKGVLY